MTVLRPGDPGYDGARRVWNAMVDRHPGLIARCRTASAVADAIALARREGPEIPAGPTRPRTGR